MTIRGNRTGNVCIKNNNSVLSIDTGDLDIVEKFAASGYITDATTNPLSVSQVFLQHVSLQMQVRR